MKKLFGIGVIVLAALIFAFLSREKLGLELDLANRVSNSIVDSEVNAAVIPNKELQKSESIRHTDQDLSAQNEHDKYIIEYLDKCDEDYLVHFSEEEKKRLEKLNSTVQFYAENGRTNTRIVRLLSYLREEDTKQVNEIYKELFQLYSDLDENKDLVGHILLLRCNGVSESLCKSDDIENLISAGEHNAATWIEAFGVYYNQGKTDKLKPALQKIISAPIYDDYWGESVNFYQDAMSIQLKPEQRGIKLIAAIGTSAAFNVSSFYQVSRYCVAESAEDREIAQLCLNVGDKIALLGENSITVTFGYGLQASVYDAIGETEAKERLTRLRNKKHDSFMPKLGRVDKIMMKDPELSAYWLQLLLSHGEVRAFGMFDDELRRRFMDKDYDPCKVKNNALEKS